MGIQSILRLLSVISLEGALLYEMFFLQGMYSFRWYEWVIVVFSVMCMLSSIGMELATGDSVKYDFDKMDKEDYVGVRFCNLLISSGLVWKTVILQQVLPFPFVSILTVIVVVGLFSTLNFFYWLISLPFAFSIFCVTFYLKLSGWCYWLSIFGIVTFSCVIMLSYAQLFNMYRILKDEYDYIFEELMRRIKDESKWWKLWN